MNAAQILHDIEAAGGHISPNGDKIKLTAPKPLPADLIQAIKDNKAEVLKIYRQRNKPSPDWDATDWQVFYNERAAICEHDGGLSRSRAEEKAFECSVLFWLNLNPPAANSFNGDCPHCSKPLGEKCIPALAGGGHVWLHHACHQPWRDRRNAKAVAALKDMGVG